MKSTTARLALGLQRDALRFAEADANSDLTLTFDEFYTMRTVTGSNCRHAAG